MKTRAELRLIAILLLYKIYIFRNIDLSYDLDNFLEEYSEDDQSFSAQLISGVISNEKDITKMANKYLENWTIDRLSLVDKAILSLGIYELLYTDVPNIVAINEAIELAKACSDEKVVKMINATLDKILHNEAENE